MTCYYDYRLHQIELLLHAYGDDKQFNDEVEKLKQERRSILKQLRCDE